MNGRDLCDDIAAILVPAPKADEVDTLPADVLESQLADQRALSNALRAAWEEGTDPLLDQAKDARRRRLQAEQDLRNLIAYAREFMHPRPYRLLDLAEAAGLSVSGVRINYDKDDVALVAELLDRRGSASQKEGGVDG